MLLKEFYHHTNWLAIIVAALVYFAIGSAWYSVLFRKSWMEGHKIPQPGPEDMARMKKQMPLMMLKTLAMGFVMAYCIALVGFGFESARCLAGIKVGLLLSAVASIPMVMSHMYLQKPAKVIAIDTAYHAVSITLMSIIISVWH
jgi:hypothetical protein